MAAGRWVLYERAVHGLPSTVNVRVKGVPGLFAVPRLYLACHRVLGSDVPWLADLYGWEVHARISGEGGGGGELASLGRGTRER
jgi:hypothetical protein